MGLPHRRVMVFAKPEGMQTTLLEMTSGDFTATTTAAVETFVADGLEDSGLGGHGSTFTDLGAA